MDTHRPQILCVDDEPHVLAGLANTLRQKFNVTAATGARQALEILADGPPFAVVVSDFAMPEMDGVQFLSQASHVASDSVRILLTGHASLDGAIAAVNEGHIFRFLTKPCPPETLIRTLDAAVEQSRLVTADRELLERRLDAMSQSLIRAERLASLGTMAGAVGHELNNVLMVFMGTMELVSMAAERGIPPTPEQLKTLQRGQDQLKNHARNLLQFGRPSKDGAVEASNLVTGVHDVLTMLRLGGVTKRVQIGLDLPASVVTVRMGKSPLEQIIVNLVKNAVEAMEEARRPDPRIDITVTCERGCGTAVCAIADNGPGIPEASLGRLFEPYYTTKPVDRGTGLGLFVVQRLLQGAGGDVTVGSTPGEGTRFVLTIPLAAARPARAPLSPDTVVCETPTTPSA